MNIKPLLTMALTASLAACGGGGGGGGGGGSHASSTSTQTTSSAAQSVGAASSATQSLATISDVGLSTLVSAPAKQSPLSKLNGDARTAQFHTAQQRAMRIAKDKAGKIHQAAKAAAGKAAISTYPLSGTDVPCTDGGTFSYNGSYTYDDVALVWDETLNMTFNSCREPSGNGYGEEMHGDMSYVAQYTVTDVHMDMTLGDGDGVVEPGVDYESKLFSNNWANFYGTYVSDVALGVDFTVSDAGTPADYTDDTYTYTYSANGGENYNQFTDVFTLVYNNFTATSVYAGDWLSGSDTVDGGFAQTWPDGQGGTAGIAIAFSNMITTWADLYDDINGFTGFTYTVDGGVTLDFTPDVLCAEGTSNLATVKPVKYMYDVGHTVEGVITINQTTKLTYNANGSVTVTDPNGSTTYSDISDLELLCPIQDTGDSTQEINDSGSGTAPADKMMVTLTWTDNDANTIDTSDMDLHLNYYASQTPTGSDLPDSFVSWRGKVVCASPLDATVYWYGMDTNSDGVCDAGLDFDETSGYGPEHITGINLPDGYYVVSVNSFDLWYDVRAKVTVSIALGGTLFTFPVHKFTTYDFEAYYYQGSYSADPTAWHAVADIRVKDGMATVMAHDVNLLPWAHLATMTPAAAARIKATH